MSADTTSRAEFVRRLAGRKPPNFPSQQETIGFLKSIMEILFPHFADKKLGSDALVEKELDALQGSLREILSRLGDALPAPAERLAAQFMDQLPSLYEKLVLDAEAIFRGDPAAHSADEVILAYPGFFAIAVYRIAHEFYARKIPIFPRMLTEHAHERTGIDINPGATIGHSFFIDHGTGIVVGETTVIEDNVKLYQGVTLGALSVDKGKANTKRHPTIQANSVIYSNATILGGETVVGHDSIIGGNVWLTESVPPFSVVYHQSEVKVRQGSGVKV